MIQLLGEEIMYLRLLINLMKKTYYPYFSFKFLLMFLFPYKNLLITIFCWKTTLFIYFLYIIANRLKNFEFLLT